MVKYSIIKYVYIHVRFITWIQEGVLKIMIGLPKALNTYTV